MLRSEMDKVLQRKLQHIIDTRRQLLLEHATLQAQLEEKLTSKMLTMNTSVTYPTHVNHIPSPSVDGTQELYNFNGENSIETLRIKLRELEKRCALQQLLQEEVLLELEGARKRDRLSERNAGPSNSMNSVYGCPVPDFDRISLSNIQGAKGDVPNYGRFDGSDKFSGFSEDATPTIHSHVTGRVYGGNVSTAGKAVTTEEQDPNLVELFQTADGPFETNDIRAPRMLTLERQLVHSVLISWKPPDMNSTGQTVSAYHVYVDGQFRLAVKAKEKTRALLDRVDADKPHRISVRAISTKGQSKDAECTLVVGRGMTATPGRLRATQITTNSAKLSWMPGNSNYWHRVFLNQQELYICPPGVYKVLLTDLPPDALHWVCVQAVAQKTKVPESQQFPVSFNASPRSGVDTQKLAAFIEFRTLPIGLPDPPTNVQLEPGPQDGMLLVTWLPVPQDQGAAAAATAAGAGSTLPVQGYTVCLNEHSLVEVDGSSNDHAIIPLQTIRHHLDNLGNDIGVSTSSPGTLDCDLSEIQKMENTKFAPILLGPEVPQHLFITVHSTVPKATSENNSACQNAESSIRADILKGSGGPGSLPVNLTAELLVAAAGSFQAAQRIFGASLSLHLGIDETTARRAGVPLTSETALSNNPPKTVQEEHRSTLEPGLVTVSADLAGRKLSPTADAIGTAEALLRRRKLDDHDDHSAPHSSPEMNLSELERDFHTHRLRARTIHASAPWPWPELHTSQCMRPNRPGNAGRQRMDSKHARKLWRQVRSMSDDHYPPLSYAQQEEVEYDLQDSYETIPVQGRRLPGSNQWFRTASLYNLHPKRPICGKRPRGLAKSSWDLRNLALARGYMEEDQLGKVDRGRFDSIHRPWVPVDQTYQDYIPQHGCAPWDDYTKRRVTIPGSTFNRFVRTFRDPFEVERPGPILKAFSSSSNDEKCTFYVPDLSHDYPLDGRQLSPPFHKLSYPIPRSRSTSPHRPRHHHGPRVLSTTWASRVLEDSHPATPELLSYQPPDSDKTHRRSHRNVSQSCVPSRRHIQASKHSGFSVPDIHVYHDSEVSGPLRRTRSKYIDPRGYNEEPRSRVPYPPRVGVSENRMDQLPLQRTFKIDPNPPPGGRRTLQATEPSFGAVAGVSHYPSEPAFFPTTRSVPTSNPVSSRMPIGQKQGIPQQCSNDFSAHPHRSKGEQAGIDGSHAARHLPDPKNMRMVIALYAYDPATMSPNPDAVQEELPFQEGQIIKIFGDCDEDGFYYGECNGLRGLVPSNMVSRPERDISTTGPTCTNAGNRMEPVTNHDRLYAPSLQSLPPGQLSRPRHKDSVGTNLSHQNISSLPAGTSMTGQLYGSTPAMQTEELVPATQHSRRTHPVTSTPQYGTTAATSTVYDRDDSDYSGPRQTTSGAPTREPSSRPPVQPMPRPMRVSQLINSSEPRKPPISGAVRQMVALYDYDPSVLSPNADAERELSFRTGERIVVYGEMDEDGFYEGELSNGRRGLVPSNFLGEIRSDRDTIDRQTSLTTSDGHQRSQPNSAVHVDRTYANDPLPNPMATSTSAGYIRNQEQIVPLDRVQLRELTAGGKLSASQSGFRNEVKEDMNYHLQPRMGHVMPGINEDQYWDRQPVYGDAQKW